MNEVLRRWRLLVGVMVAVLGMGLAVVVPSLLSSAQAATFWVSPSGSSTNPCTQAAPCRVVNDAYQLAGPGDVITLTDGVHPAQSVIERSLSQPNVVVEPESSDASVVFDGSFYVETPNLTLRGIRGGEIYFKPTAHNGILEDAYMVNGSGHVQLREANNLTVRNSVISGGFDLDPLQIVGGDGHLVENNIMGGVELDLQYHPLYQSGAHPSTYPHPDCVQVMGGSNLTFRNNVIFGCWTETILIKPDFHPISNVLFENNFIQDCVSRDDWCAAHFAVQVYRTPINSTDNVRFVNNTVDGSIIIRDGVTNSDWSNNIVETFQAQPPVDPTTGNTAWGTPALCSTYGIIENNLIGSNNCDALPASTVTGHPTYAVPQTARPSDLTGPDLHLAIGSLGIDAANSSSPTLDIDGEPRNGPADIGADEHGTTSTSSTTTVPTTTSTSTSSTVPPTTTTSTSSTVPPTTTTSTTVVSSGPVEVVFVTASLSPNSQDQAVIDRLVGLGHNVTIADDSVVTAADVVGVDLVVVSDRVGSTRVAQQLSDVAVPVMIWEYAQYDDFGLSSAGRVNRKQTSITLSSTSHPVTAGLGTNLTVFSSRSNLGSAVPVSDAVTLATNSGEAVLFILESGDQRIDGTAAPACRIAYPTSLPTRHTADAWTLFDQTTAHALTNCGG